MYTINTTADWNQYVTSLIATEGKASAQLVQQAFLNLAKTEGSKRAAQALVEAVNNNEWALIADCATPLFANA